MDRLGRPRRLGGGRGRRGAGLARVAARRAGAARAGRAAAPGRARRAPPGGGRGAGGRTGGRPAHGLWDKAAGAEALALLDEIAAEAEAAGPLSAHEYRALLAALMATRDVPEEAVVTHAGIAIWGTLEARVQSADLVILGGLNEGIWPRLPGADPWLGRGIRRAIGLGSPERRIGLSAHDFQQAMGAPRVVLTRATRDAEAPTVASRWLLRLENLLLGLGPEGEAALGAAKARGRRLLADAARLDVPATPVPPAPPAGAAAAGGGAPCRAAGHPGREAGARPLRRLRAHRAAPLPARPARPPARRADPRQADPRRARRLRHRHRGRTAARCGRALPRHCCGGAGRARAVAGGSGGLDRAPRPRRRVVPRQRSRPPRARRPGGARAQGPPRGRGPGAAFRDHRPGRPHRPGARRLRDLRLQVGREPLGRRGAGPSTCSCRSRRRSPRPAASRACPRPRRGTSSS